LTDRIEEFIAAGGLRDPDWSSYASSESYARLILGLAASRPHALLLAGDPGEPRARALVAQSLGDTQAAVLGLFEAISGAAGDEAAERVIAEAGAWARGRGLVRLYAPVDLNTWFDYRFILPAEPGASAAPLRPWEPIHPPAYLERFRAAGFGEAERYETVAVLLPRTGAYTSKNAVEYTHGAWKKAVDEGITFGRLTDPSSLPALLDELHPLCMAAFADNPLFEPLPATVFRAIYASAIASRDAGATHWARDANGRPVGFVFAFREDDTMVVKTIAVDPALRGRQLSSALIHLVMRTAVENGVHDFISALVRRGNTSNFLSKAHLMPGVGSWKREYALLAREVAP
jgi:GNAT superfamily N-acetyltransferase